MACTLLMLPVSVKIELERLLLPQLSHCIVGGLMLDLGFLVPKISTNLKLVLGPANAMLECYNLP